MATVKTGGSAIAMDWFLQQGTYLSCLRIRACVATYKNSIIFELLLKLGKFVGVFQRNLLPSQTFSNICRASLGQLFSHVT